MIHDVWGHATVLEVVRALAAYVGVVLNLWGLFDAIADRRWLREVGLNGRREAVARWHVIMNGGLAFVQVAFAWAGTVALVTPTAHYTDYVAARVSAQVLYTVAEPVLVWIAVEARLYRMRLLASRSISKTRQAGADLIEEEA